MPAAEHWRSGQGDESHIVAGDREVRILQFVTISLVSIIINKTENLNSIHSTNSR